MSIAFTQLFALPDGLVQEGVLSALSWKELSRLDEALNNRRLRSQFHKLLPVLDLSYTLSTATPISFLSWVKKRGMHINSMCVDRADDSMLRAFQESGVQVKLYLQMTCKQNKQTAIAALLGTLHMLCTVSMVAVWNDLDTLIWADALRNCRHLATIRICTESALDNCFITSIAKHCSKLEDLALAKCSGVDDTSVVLLAQQCPSLHTLRLRGCAHLTDRTLQALGQGSRDLFSLTLQAESGCVTDAGMICLLTNCLLLFWLELWDCSGVTAASITALSPLCAELTALALPRCNVFEHPAVTPVLRQLHSLSHLDLNGCTNLSADTLVAIFETSLDLQCVDLSNIATVTNDVLAELVRLCSSLWSLHISGCQQVTDLTVLGHCQNLTYLQIKDCKGVSDATLLQLVFACHTLEQVHATRSGVTAATTKQTLDATRCLLLMDRD